MVSDSRGHIFLTGFMGAGKTTVGRVLAERLGWDFLDLDRFIEGRVGCGIPEIFATQGEGAFRDAESQALHALSGDPPRVVATGGGIVGREENRRRMRELGRVVFLDLPWAELLPRLQSEGGRPLATGEGGWETVRQRWEARLPLYREAELRIACAGLTPAEIAHRIILALHPGGDHP
ncbi:shikimate kinase [Geoalkalibacter sp.]|uniref:shikimate kinase n=1 Tax=Geoalkalibacter sp. TaxID=3041440 RepID=UPI00272EDAA3|nr:shikimate kinase [Geoalkalibacter sp.]